MGRLEHVLADRINDIDGARERDERNLCFLKHRDHRHGGAGGRAANHCDDLVVLDQAGGECARLVGISTIVIDNEVDLFAGDTACGIDLVDIHPKRLVFRLTQKRCRTCDRQNRANLDGLLGKRWGAQG